jgi:hypothetical protein
MTEYRPVLDELRERRKGKPGEFLLILGLLPVVIAPVVLAIVHGEAAEYNLLKADGVVAEAEILAHKEEEIYNTSQKGRDRSTTAHILEVRYDAMSATPYAQWKQTGKIVPAQYPALVNTEFEVASAYLATNAVGSKQPVVSIRNNPSTMRLVETVEYETSSANFLRYYLAMGALFVAGIAMMVVGWRKRKAHV